IHHPCQTEVLIRITKASPHRGQHAQAMMGWSVAGLHTKNLLIMGRCLFRFTGLLIASGAVPMFADPAACQQAISLPMLQWHLMLSICQHRRATELSGFSGSMVR